MGAPTPIEPPSHHHCHAQNTPKIYPKHVPNMRQTCPKTCPKHDPKHAPNHAPNMTQLRGFHSIDLAKCCIIVSLSSQTDQISPHFDHSKVPLFCTPHTLDPPHSGACKLWQRANSGSVQTLAACRLWQRAKLSSNPPSGDGGMREAPKLPLSTNMPPI